MPIMGGGGDGGGGPAAGTYWPVADAAGVTVDTTTYPDNIKGGGAKLTTIVFPDAQGSLAMALAGDAHPRVVMSSDITDDGWCFGDGSFDPPGNGPGFSASGSNLRLGGSAISISLQRPTSAQAASIPSHVPRIDQLSPTSTITDGALPTVAFVSGTARQVSTSRDAQLIVPVTYNPGVATTATCKVELSADNVTFTEVVTVTKPVGTVFDGQIDPVDVRVPAAWYVKLTVVNATLGTGTFY